MGDVKHEDELLLRTREFSQSTYDVLSGIEYMVDVDKVESYHYAAVKTLLRAHAAKHVLLLDYITKLEGK